MVKNFKWRSNPNIVARLVDGRDITTLVSRRVILKPNEACAFIVNGRVGDIISQDIVSNLGGGIARKIADFMGLTAVDRRMLFAITGPINLLIPYQEYLANGQLVSGKINLKVQIRADDIAKLLNIFTNSAPLLERNMLAAFLQAEVNTRVVIPMLNSIDDISQLRQPQFQDSFETRCSIELRSTLNSIGLTLLKAFVISKRSDIEKVNNLRAELKIATETEAAHASALQQRIELREATALRRIECEINVAKAKERGQIAVAVESELATLRKQEAHWDAELRRDAKRAELELKIKQQRDERSMRMFEQVQSRKQIRISHNEQQRARRAKSQNELQERMMTLAAKHGSLTSDVMKEFLRQQRAQNSSDIEVN